MGLIDKAKDVAGDAVGRASRAAGPAIDRTKDVAGAVIVNAVGAAGPAIDKTKDVAGEVIVRAVGVAGPALEKSKAATQTAGHLVAGTVAELKGKVFPNKPSD